MGIPYYFYTITKTYDGIVLATLPPDIRCTHLYFDFNGLIHPSAHKCLASLAKIPTDIEKAIMAAVWKDTMAIVKMVDPSATVQIFIDGVAPIAKMAQQRKRRFMSIFRKTLTGETTIWDTNAISPGTAFMTRLHASIRAHIRNSKADYKFAFSSSDEAGEGEHKIFAQIGAAGGTGAPDETTVIYGMDADLIMLALFSHRPKIYLLREGKTPGEYIYLSIDELRKGILKDLVANYQWTIAPSTDPYDKASREAIETYCVVCFLLGNDFIPHPISLNLKKGGLEDLLIQAGKVWTTLGAPAVNTETETIHWMFMAQLLQVLGQHENETIFDVVSDHHKKRPNDKDKDKNLVIDAYPLVHKDAFTTDLLFKIDRKKWRQYYYKALFHSNINDTTVILNACDLYIKGILWTYQYYKRKPKDNEWYYPYNYAPTLRDVTNYLNGQMPYYEGLAKTKEWTGKDVFCTPIVQLLSILPKESADVLPAKYKKIMLEHTGLQYLYPKMYKIQTFMKTKLWECNQDIPPLNVQFVKKCVTGA